MAHTPALHSRVIYTITLPASRTKFPYLTTKITSTPPPTPTTTLKVGVEYHAIGNFVQHRCTVHFMVMSNKGLSHGPGRHFSVAHDVQRTAAVKRSQNSVVVVYTHPSTTKKPRSMEKKLTAVSFNSPIEKIAHKYGGVAKQRKQCGLVEKRILLVRMCIMCVLVITHEFVSCANERDRRYRNAL